jgi:hypothetical protein
MDALMGANPWPYGVPANKAILTAFMGYLVDQKFLPQAKPVEELFAPIVDWTE